MTPEGPLNPNLRFYNLPTEASVIAAEQKETWGRIRARAPSLCAPHPPPAPSWHSLFPIAPLALPTSSRPPPGFTEPPHLTPLPPCPRQPPASSPDSAQPSPIRSSDLQPWQPLSPAWHCIFQPDFCLPSLGIAHSPCLGTRVWLLPPQTFKPQHSLHPPAPWVPETH